jgi:hypothetical protein
MADFVQTIPTVGRLLDSAGVPWTGRNFEDIYSSLVLDPARAELASDLRHAISDYFSVLALPDEPTIYDALLLSLREKDTVATFNWDPFLIQAAERCSRVTTSLPYLAFLHGNVAHGYCAKDNVSGIRGRRCSRCKEQFEPDPLLFPVATKDYSSAPAIVTAWENCRRVLQDALFVTVFGYGAPSSDHDAIALLSRAWGSPNDRQFEQFDIIDIRPAQELRSNWAAFIHTHHYEVVTNFWDSFLANHPRRSVEAFVNQFIEAKLIEINQIPRLNTLAELHAWFRPLVDAELTRLR